MNMSVKIGKLELKSPVMVASGTFGIGEEYSEFIDINKIGAIVTKTITLNGRKGNPPPRIVETPAGMLNSIGLENKGADDFVKNKLPFLKKLKTHAIISVGAEDPGELPELVRKLDAAGVRAIELNISCPNVKSLVASRWSLVKVKGKRLVSQDPQATFEVVKSVRDVTDLTLITKLSPNVTDIAEIAKAAEEAGSDAVALVNTFLGMAVDIETRKPKLGAATGGLSGPAIKPLALRMVREVYNNVDIPVIGIGGIMNCRDALEFIVCGAAAVQIGTANFINPAAAIEIIKGMEEFLKEKKINNIKDLVGTLRDK